MTKYWSDPTHKMVIIILALSFIVLLSASRGSGEDYTSFECGFDTISSTRSGVSLKFYLLIIIFLLFDVELLLLFPLVRLSNLNMWILISILFLVGLIHEKNEGTISWMSH